MLGIMEGTHDTSTDSPGSLRVPMCHAFMQLLGGTKFGLEPAGPCLPPSLPQHLPARHQRPLGTVGLHTNREKAVEKVSNDPHPHPFHPLPSCLVDSWPSQCGLGRLRKFSSRAPGSQEQELPQAISVPGSPFKGFLDR